MTNEAILDSLRRLLRTGTCDNADMVALLTAHGCSFLVQKDKLADVVSVVAVKERYKHAKLLFEALKDIPYAVIKGAVLSEQLYGSPFVRRSGDLDILLRRQDLRIAKKVLLEHGFVQGRVVGERIEPFSRQELIFQASQSHQTAPFVKATGNKLCPFINYDLNTSVFWGEYENGCDMDWVLSETENTSLFGQFFRKLSPEMEFLALCMHHYKDMNSIYLLVTGGLKLSLFCDIYFYLKNVSLDTEKLHRLSIRLNAVPYVYYCLWYTNQVFDADFLLPLLTRFRSPEGEAQLYNYGLCGNERRKWEIGFLDRLFSTSFRENFYNRLDEKAKKKVRVNRKFM